MPSVPRLSDCSGRGRTAEANSRGPDLLSEGSRALPCSLAVGSVLPTKKVQGGISSCRRLVKLRAPAALCPGVCRPCCFAAVAAARCHAPALQHSDCLLFSALEVSSLTVSVE